MSATSSTFETVPRGRRKPRERSAIRTALFLGALVIIGAAAATAFWPSDSDGSRDFLTHTIKRGDLTVSVTEQGTLESSNNTEIKCKVRGFSTVTYVVPAGTVVEQGRELVRLDTKVIEEQYSLTKTNTFIAQATLAQTEANVEKAKIAIDAYEQGRYKSQLQSLEKELAVHKRNLRTARKMYERSKSLFRQGYVTDLEVEGNAFTVTQAELELKVKETEIKVLKDFTRKMQLETLGGNKTASESKLAADQAGLAMEIKRRDRAAQELEDCVIRAEKSGLVIYPSAASWKSTPDITEGATVRKDQVLLLMPDLSQMQVKLGIHESVIDRVKPGLKAIVTLPDRTLEANVSEVASVTRPAGWWTGNVVKYDTVIKLPQDKGLKPGMSAEVEVVLAVHSDVLLIPVAAVVETAEGEFCWIQSKTGPKRRMIELGDSNDVFIEILAGLSEGDEVILNPTRLVEEAEEDALKTLEQQSDTIVSSGNTRTESDVVDHATSPLRHAMAEATSSLNRVVDEATSPQDHVVDEATSPQDHVVDEATSPQDHVVDEATSPGSAMDRATRTLGLGNFAGLPPQYDTNSSFSNSSFSNSSFLTTTATLAHCGSRAW